VAAVGDFSRFDDPDKLVACVSLNPRVRQSGNSAAARLYQRIQARRGCQTAVVATARKMTVLAWLSATRDEDYAFARARSGHPQASPGTRPGGCRHQRVG
jgi:transposase